MQMLQRASSLVAFIVLSSACNLSRSARQLWTGTGTELKSFAINDRARDCSRNDYRNEFIISYDMQVRCSVSFKSAVDDEQKKNRAINRVIKHSSIFNVQKLNH